MKLSHLKSLLVASLLLLPFERIHSQTHLKLILETSLAIDSAYIVNFVPKEVMSVPFKDTLELDFKTGYAGFYHINYTHKEKIYNAKLYLDAGDITVFMLIENNKLLVTKVTGSLTYEMTQIWRKRFTQVTQRKDNAAMDSFLLKTYEEQIENLFSFSIGGRYLDLHQNDKLKLYALLPLIARQTDSLKMQFGFTFLNDRLQGIIRNNIISLSDFDLIDLKNKLVHTSAADSGFVILDFWFVGCLPCMVDHEKISGLLPFLEQKQVELISISNDDSYSKWKEYLEKHNYEWQHYKKPPGSENIISELGITTYPTYILLRKTGQIVFSTYSLEEVLKQL